MPKDTTSESESKSGPMGEWASRSRAAKPSRKSKSPATRIIRAALIGIPEAINKMEKQPDNRLPQVMTLGMCFLRFMGEYFNAAKIVFFDVEPN